MKHIYLNIKYFFKNLYFVFLRTDCVIKSFAGYGRFWLAKKYADKRTRTTSKDGVTGRKRHFVFPYNNKVVFVCNRTEINSLIRSKMIKQNIDIKYLLENAYYISR
jgi:hypothetical protein